MKNKAYGMIGLAMKAGKIVSGEFLTEKSVKEGTACMVIVACDASDNTKKRFRDKCSYYKTPLRIFGDKENLGRAMGKEFRASLAVTDSDFTKQIMKHIDNLS